MCWLHIVVFLCLAICLNGIKKPAFYYFNSSLRFLRISLLISLNPVKIFLVTINNCVFSVVVWPEQNVQRLE